MRRIFEGGVPGGWSASGAGIKQDNLGSQARNGAMDPGVIHKRLLQIIALVYAKPFAALPPAMPVFSSHPLRQMETERVGAPIHTEHE